MDNQENGGWENANGFEESNDEQGHFDDIMADPEPQDDYGMWDADVNEEENWNLFNMNGEQNGHVAQVIPQVQVNVNPLALQQNGNNIALQPHPIHYVEDAGLLDNLEWLNIFNFGGIGEEVDGLGQDPIAEDIPQIQENGNGNHIGLQQIQHHVNHIGLNQIQVNGNHLALQQIQVNGNHLGLQQMQHGLWDNIQNMNLQNIANLVGDNDQGPVGGLEGWDYANGIEVIPQALPNQALGLYAGEVNGEQNDHQNLELQLNNDPPADEFF